VKLKHGVIFDGVTGPIWYALGIADLVCEMYAGFELVVTSLKDGKHSDASLHYSGNAFDLRTRTMTEEQLGLVYNSLKLRLKPRGFDVVLEKTHIHVEYDPKGRNLFTWTV
jgi:hypothetical protein